MTRRADRRSEERRQRDRRRQQERRTEGLSPSADPAHASVHKLLEAPSSLTAALGVESELNGGGPPAREARQMAPGPGSALTRIVRTYAAARAAVGLALVVAQGVVGSLGSAVTPAVLAICLVRKLLASSVAR